MLAENADGKPEAKEVKPLAEKVDGEPHEECVLKEAELVAEKVANVPLAEEVEMAEEPVAEKVAELPPYTAPPIARVNPDAEGRVDTRRLLLPRDRETPEIAVQSIQRDENFRRVPAVSDLTSVDELLLGTGTASFVDLDADRRHNWQRLFNPNVANLELVPPLVEPIPYAMRPALEVVREVLQRQPNPEALSGENIQRILAEELIGKAFWTHEASRVLHVKRISRDSAFEAEVRSQAEAIARYSERYPRRVPLQSRVPHCPVDMPLAAVFLWKRMPLQLPWWPLLVAIEANIGLWPLERAYIVQSEEQVRDRDDRAPGRERHRPIEAPDREDGAPRGDGRDPNGASDREGGVPGGRSKGGRMSLNDRAKQLQASGRFDFAHRITGQTEEWSLRRQWLTTKQLELGASKSDVLQFHALKNVRMSLQARSPDSAR